MWRFIFILLSVNLLFAYKSQIDHLKFVLADIQAHANQPNNSDIVEDLETFLNTEENIRSSFGSLHCEEALDSKKILAELLVELKIILRRLIADHQVVLKQENELLSAETYSFKQYVFEFTAKSC